MDEICNRNIATMVFGILYYVRFQPEVKSANAKEILKNVGKVDTIYLHHHCSKLVAILCFAMDFRN